MASSSPSRFSEPNEVDDLMNSSPMGPSPRATQGPRGTIRRRDQLEDDETDPNPFARRMPPLNLRAATLNQSDLADLQNFARSKKLKREHVEDIVKFMNLPSGPLLHEG
ncbi:hypothetical protein FB45DRAFT_1028579 [Roridomyces roridus]|uniref:Uncharacterized protein n=1 Tax=Roridomyces roridus TaxID=1738132 RepID=A0AAD7FJX4_9AGAR|nr:hypothetical protein FB45DRAFT_1028579 [Roridomyces roridus]